jgi:SAM-dependent methyltransferase
MENFWDQRYSEPGFAYGQDPNEFFKEIIDDLEPGSLMLPGEGEGRNAIYAARKGWKVFAFDQSSVAREKALAWAENEELSLDYRVEDLTSFSCTGQQFDLVAILYIHLPWVLRQSIHRQLAACLKPGGMLIMECFHKEQLLYGTGGPPVGDLLYHEDDLMEDFSSMDIIQCEKQIREIHQGKYHKGKSSVIRLKALKQSE